MKKILSIILLGICTISAYAEGNPLVDGYFQNDNPLVDGYVQNDNPLVDGYIQDDNPLVDGYVQDLEVFGIYD